MARLNYVAKFRGTTKTDDGNLTCGKCGEPVKPGDAYSWWANRLPGARSSVRRIRCVACPPKLSERTPGRRGELLAIQEDATERLNKLDATATDPDDFTSVAFDAADELRGIAEGLREAAEAVEEGFGHATSTSEEMEERADDLAQQADEAEDVTVEPAPERGEFETEDEYETALEDWRADAHEIIEDVVSNFEMP